MAASLANGGQLLPRDLAQRYSALHSPGREADSVRKIAHDARVKSQRLAGRFCTPYDACRILSFSANGLRWKQPSRPRIIGIARRGRLAAPRRRAAFRDQSGVYYYRRAQL